jgi:heme exporter protein A
MRIDPAGADPRPAGGARGPTPPISRSAIEQVRTTKLAKRYGHHRALAGVDVTLDAGSVCALLGPNGAGKTTLLGILSTLVRPTGGSVEYRAAGGPVAPGDRLRREIGLLAHATLCYGELTAVENLMFFAGLYGVADAAPRVREVLDQVGLDPRARERPARTFSRGMWQRLALARALLARPSVVLLDEPFTGLDRGGALALGTRLAEVKAAGAIVVVVTHDLEAIAGVTDHVAVLRDGKLVHDDRRAAGYDYADLKAIYQAHGGAFAPSAERSEVGPERGVERSETSGPPQGKAR